MHSEDLEFKQNSQLKEWLNKMRWEDLELLLSLKHNDLQDKAPSEDQELKLSILLTE